MVGRFMHRTHQFARLGASVFFRTFLKSCNQIGCLCVFQIINVNRTAAIATTIQLGKSLGSQNNKPRLSAAGDLNRLSSSSRKNVAGRVGKLSR